MSRDDDPTEEIRRTAGARARAGEAPFLTAGSRLRDGRYVLERLLGRGGMATVWLARDERLERAVAIKVLADTLAGDRDYLARFEREARVAAGVTHPNLVSVYDYGAKGGRPFLVMEHVDGGDLAGRLASGRPPDPDRLAAELLGALRHIHRAGVLHRDVKPQNVLVGRDGRARLTDFGIAQPRDATSLTQTGTVLGTARYLAPEVLAGGSSSERSDLYSLGVVAIAVFATGGGEEPEPAQPAASSGERDGEGRGEGAGGDRGAGEGREAGEREPDPPSPGDGFELNDQGYSLIQRGRPDEAIPVLERAVSALEGTDDVTYAYALFNLGNALRLAGRAEEAIPILEARLEIPNQRGAVKRELDAARQVAGVDDDGRDRGSDDD